MSQALLKQENLPKKGDSNDSYWKNLSWSDIAISSSSSPHKTSTSLLFPTSIAQSQQSPNNNYISNNLSSIRLTSKLHLGINKDFFLSITKKFLDNFYPKTCNTPACENHILDKEISTRPDVIRCSKCHSQQSRLSYTPLHHFKLDLWMFGYVFHESLIQFPKVLTSREISKRLKIGYKAASLLKRRFQLFCSDQLPKYKDLTYNALNHQFKDFLLPPNENKDISKKMANKPYVCVDTAVLYSAGERANKGRKRYSSKGQTSSIYLSPKLGGKQVGTLVQTIGEIVTFNTEATFQAAIKNVRYVEGRPRVPHVSSGSANMRPDLVAWEKGKDWETEKEVRLLTHTIKDERTRVVKIPDDCLREVIFGFKVENDAILKIRDVIAKKYPGVTFFKASPDDYKFSVNIDILKS